MKKYTFHCKACRKSLKIMYTVTGNNQAPVLPNIDIICPHCKRVMFLKRFTEKKLLEGAVGNRFYM